MKFLANLDLQKNELQNAAIQNLATDPGTPVQGQIYYNTVSDAIKVYDGAAWVTLSTGSGTVTSVTGTGAISSSGGATPAISIADASTTVKGAVQLEDSYASTSTTKAATPAAVKAAYDLANGKANPSDATFVGTTSVALNRTSANLALTGISSVALPGSSSGTTTLQPAAAAGGTVTLPASTGTLALTSDIPSLTGYVTETGTQTLTNKTLTSPKLNEDVALTATATELNYVDGVTSAIQTQLDAKLPKSGGTMTGAIAMGTSKITGLGTPTDAADAATKAYVDSAAQGIDWKASVRAATTAALYIGNAVQNGSVLDGVTLATGDRILIKDQGGTESPTTNGIYVVTAGMPDRAADADTGAELTSNFAVFVEEGTVNADQGYVLTNNGPITIGTTELAFTQFTGLGQITAGTGLTKTGNTLNAVGTADRITANGDSIDIASTYAGQSTIVTLGTVTTGTWSATDIAVAAGGTGASDAGTARTNLGLAIGSDVQAYNATLAAVAGGTYSGDDSITTVGTIAAGTWQGTAIASTYGGALRYNTSATWTAGEAKTVTHNLGTKAVVVSVYDSGDAAVLCDVVTATTNTLTVTISLAGTYRVVVLG